MNKRITRQRFSAAFALICFLSGELLHPTGIMAMPLAVTEVTASSAFQLELPPELGTVEMLVSGQGPTVIHIQEAHGNYESEKNIESILHFLKDRYGVDLLLLEGNAFQLHTDLLNFFPGRDDLNRSILEDLAIKNLASGPEFFLQKSPETEAWGIEDAAQYRENGQAFVQVLTQRTKTEVFVNAMDLQIERLTSPYLNKDLRQYLKRLESFEGGITPLAAWIHELKGFAVKYLQKDITSPALQLEWPMLVRFFVLEEFQKRLDLKAFQKESPAFLEAIKDVPETILGAVKGHLESALSQSKLSDPDTSILFENMVAALPSDFDYSRFPNVTLFIGHLILQSELKGERLFGEMAQLSDLAADQLAREPREKEITGLLKKHRLLKRLFSLELTAQDYEVIKAASATSDKSQVTSKETGRPTTFQPSAFIKQFEHLNSDKLVKDYQFEHMDEVDALYQRALEFYQGAKERDGTMLKKIEERMETSGKDRAAVITGGFHAGPFKAFFESKGYNYALITPKMSQDITQSRKAYVGSVLANYIAPLQPEKATYRPAPYVVLTAPERLTLGISPKVEQRIRSSMVEIARQVAGLSEPEIREGVVGRQNLGSRLSMATAKSEVRVGGDRRWFLHTAAASLAAGAAMLNTDTDVSAEEYRASKAARELADRRTEEATKILVRKIFDLANDTSDTLKIRRKNPDFFSSKAITAVNGGDFNGGAEGFTMEDAKKLVAQGINENNFKSHVKWRRLVMDMLADIVRTFETGKDAKGVSQVPRLTQEKIGELAWHLQTVKPRDILSASLAGTPVFTERDLDKFVLYKDSDSFLYAYARAKVKIELGVGDRDFYDGLLTPDVLESDFMNYIPSGARAEVAKLKVEFDADPNDEEKKTALDKKLRKVREDFVYHMATVIFEMENTQITPLRFDTGDASYLANENWPGKPKTIRGFIEYLAYRRSAQLFVAKTAEKLMVTLYDGMRDGVLAKQERLKEVSQVLPSKRAQAVLDKLIADYLENPDPKKDDQVEDYFKRKKPIIGVFDDIVDDIKGLIDKYKALRFFRGELTLVEMNRFAQEYEAILSEKQAHIIWLLTDQNPKLLAPDDDAIARDIPLPYRFQAAVSLIGNHPYQIELLLGRPERIEMLKKDFRENKGVLLNILLQQHPGILDLDWALDAKTRIGRKPVGFFGNKDVIEKGIKDELLKFINADENRPLFIRIRNELLLTQRSEVRETGRTPVTDFALSGQAKSEVRQTSFSSRDILTPSVYRLGDKSPEVVDLISQIVPTVVVTAQAATSFRPHVEFKIQERKLQKLRALFDKATANQPLQAVDHRTSVPSARELLTILAILVKMPSVKVAMTILDTEGKLPAVIKELERLARQKIMGFQTLEAIKNLRIRAYTAGDPLSAVEGDFLNPLVETAFISPDLVLAEKTTFVVGAVLYEPKMRVHVGEEILHSDALVAAFWTLLNEKSTQTLGLFEAKDLVKGKLASLIRDLKNLEKIMSAA